MIRHSTKLRTSLSVATVWGQNTNERIDRGCTYFWLYSVAKIQKLSFTHSVFSLLWYKPENPGGDGGTDRHMQWALWPKNLSVTEWPKTHTVIVSLHKIIIDKGFIFLRINWIQLKPHSQSKQSTDTAHFLAGRKSTRVSHRKRKRRVIMKISAQTGEQTLSSISLWRRQAGEESLCISLSVSLCQPQCHACTTQPCLSSLRTELHQSSAVSLPFS